MPSKNRGDDWISFMLGTARLKTNGHSITITLASNLLIISEIKLKNHFTYIRNLGKHVSRYSMYPTLNNFCEVQICPLQFMRVTDEFGLFLKIQCGLYYRLLHLAQINVITFRMRSETWYSSRRFVLYLQKNTLIPIILFLSRLFIIVGSCYQQIFH